MKDLSFTELLIIYGKTLTPKQYSIMEQYYKLDYSLSEIAQNLKVSRQAIMSTIQKAGKILKNLEEQVGVLKKRNTIIALSSSVNEHATKEELIDTIQNIVKII